MSTYNGEKFIGQQLDSLLQQDYPNIDILVRDDGSKDSTVAILDEYGKQHQNIKVLKEQNKGVIASFFDLLRQASDTAEYFAFCDQDDFWKPTKISRAVELMEQENTQIPLMYFSRLDIVDENLQLLKQSQIPPKGVEFKNALIQNIATGCTIVFNKKMLNLFKSNIPDVKKITMHDSWFYLLGTAFGKVIYDEQSHLLYRQHSSNTLGMANNKFKSMMIRYKNFKKKGHEKSYTVQTEEFSHLFQDQLSHEQKRLVDDFLYKRQSFFGRIDYAINTPIFRQNKRDTIIFKMLYAFKSY